MYEILGDFRFENFPQRAFINLQVTPGSSLANIGNTHRKKLGHISMHRRPTWDISGGFQSKLDLIMQLTDGRSLELLVFTVTRLPGGKVYVTRINSYNTVMPESR